MPYTLSMDTKKIYTREDLTRIEKGPAGFDVLVCCLCGDRGLEEGDMITHEPSCPFASSAVLVIQGLTLTAPRDVICGACPAKDRPCVVPDWKQESHETLLSACGRYSVENDERTPDVDTE